ncbi:MAG: FAD-dependent oxidoreductase [Pseudomonadota bacterium]
MNQQSELMFYGAHWCPDCRRAKQFLGENQIPFKWVDIEQDSAAEQYVVEKNNGKRIIPTIVFPDGSILVEPSNAELAAKLDLKTTAEKHHYDLLVVGAGPAGLTAALYAAREGIETLVIERAAPGGQASTTEKLENVPGFAEGIKGAVFGQQLSRQATRFGAELLQAQDVGRVSSRGRNFLVETADGSRYTGEALLLATGSRYRRLGLPEEESFVGAGVHFCATCDGPFYKGKPVVVIWGGNSAAEESLLLVKYVEKVTLVVRGERLKASQVIQEKVERHPQIELRFQTEVTGLNGKEGRLAGVKVRDKKTGHTEEIPAPGAFVFIGQEPNTAFLDKKQIFMDPWGYILTGYRLKQKSKDLGALKNREPTTLETSVPGIFAAGDVRAGSTKQVASASGEGATAALLIREHLQAR